MESIYLISLIVGGVFVILSMFGGGDVDADVDVDIDLDTDFDADGDLDLGGDSGFGFSDLISVRALFLFLAFFGLTGMLLSWVGVSEPALGLTAAAIGATIGLGGNYVIKNVGYKHVSSDVTTAALNGKTAQVLLPFEPGQRGKVRLVANGQRLSVLAESFDEDTDSFSPGDEVVVVRMDGNVARVVKPS
ncbi:MAG: hypothetical protein RhofKO_20170 [Rhodothermales bacterium]